MDFLFLFIIHRTFAFSILTFIALKDSFCVSLIQESQRKMFPENETCSPKKYTN